MDRCATYLGSMERDEVAGMPDDIGSEVRSLDQLMAEGKADLATQLDQFKDADFEPFLLIAGDEGQTTIRFTAPTTPEERSELLMAWLPEALLEQRSWAAVFAIPIPVFTFPPDEEPSDSDRLVEPGAILVGADRSGRLVAASRPLIRSDRGDETGFADEPRAVAEDALIATVMAGAHRVLALLEELPETDPDDVR